VLRAQQVLQEQLVLLEPLELQVRQEPPDPLVQQGRRALTVRREQLELQVQQVQ
jgi:hypothetical protein